MSHIPKCMDCERAMKRIGVDKWKCPVCGKIGENFYITPKKRLQRVPPSSIADWDLTSNCVDNSRSDSK